VIKTVKSERVGGVLRVTISREGGDSVVYEVPDSGRFRTGIPVACVAGTPDGTVGEFTARKSPPGFPSGLPEQHTN
jgi:hypothetical protein